jgi:hypothetical protein
LASRREGLEGRFRNHSAGSARTRREGLGARPQLFGTDAALSSVRNAASRDCLHAAD